MSWASGVASLATSCACWVVASCGILRLPGGFMGGWSEDLRCLADLVYCLACNILHEIATNEGSSVKTTFAAALWRFA